MSMKKMTLGQICKVTGGKFIGDLAQIENTINSVTLDSRTVSEGALFVAIEGERSDGHEYINASLSKGAICCLAEKRVESPEGPYILVKSTLQAIKDLAEYYRGLFPETKIIGITGSVGKTTTKEMVSSVLSEKYRVHKTTGNLNNEIGVPMTIFGLREGHEVAVIEMGISEFGEMRRLSKMVRPDVALMSIIGHSHLEFLGSREGVLKAKGEIFEYANPEGIAILNGDDDLLKNASPGDFSAKASGMETVYYGLERDNEIIAHSIDNLGATGMKCEIDLGGKCFTAQIPAYGRHIIYAALAASAVGHKLGLTPEEIACGLMNFENVGKRADIVETGFLRIIDDCYNANPNSVKAALDSLTELDGRRVAILGDMGELGDSSAELHAEVGEYAVQSGIDCLIAVGARARAIYLGAKRAEKSIEAWYFPDKEELFSVLYTLVKEGDTVLVKASRSMKFEDIVTVLSGMSPAK